jgi:hypothetical protein
MCKIDQNSFFNFTQHQNGSYNDDSVFEIEGVAKMSFSLSANNLDSTVNAAFKKTMLTV